MLVWLIDFTSFISRAHCIQRLILPASGQPGVLGHHSWLTVHCQGSCSMYYRPHPYSRSLSDSCHSLLMLQCNVARLLCVSLLSSLLLSQYLSRSLPGHSNISADLSQELCIPYHLFYGNIQFLNFQIIEAVRWQEFQSTVIHRDNMELQDEDWEWFLNHQYLLWLECWKLNKPLKESNNLWPVDPNFSLLHYDEKYLFQSQKLGAFENKWGA